MRPSARAEKYIDVTLAHKRKPKFFYFGCALVRRCKCKQSASAHGTDGQTDGQTDRQTECDAYCGPSYGGGPHNKSPWPCNCKDFLSCIESSSGPGVQRPTWGLSSNSSVAIQLHRDTSALIFLYISINLINLTTCGACIPNSRIISAQQLTIVNAVNVVQCLCARLRRQDNMHLTAIVLAHVDSHYLLRASCVSGYYIY